MKRMDLCKANLAIKPGFRVSRLALPASVLHCGSFFFQSILFCAFVMLEVTYAADSVRLEKIAEIKLKAAPITVDWNMDGSLLAVAGWQSSLAIWDANTSKIILNESFGRVGFGVVKFSPDGQWLAAGRDFTDELSSLWLFDTSSWKHHDVSSARRLRSTDSLCFTHDGSRVVAATSAFRKSPYLINFRDATETLRLQPKRENKLVKNVTCHPFQSIVAVGWTAAMLEIYDTKTGSLIDSIQAFDPDWWWIEEVEFSQDGRFLFTGSNSGMTVEKLNKRTGKMEKKDRGEPIKMWDSSTLKLLRMFGDQKDGEVFLESSVRSLSHSARDGLLLAGFDGGKIRAWDVETGEERLRRSGWRSAVTAKFSHDGSRLAVADQGSRSVTIFKILDTR